MSGDNCRNPLLVAGVPDSVWRFLLFPVVAAVAGCTTDQTITDAARAPAEQQLAVTKAVDHAVENLRLEVAPSTRVFVDSSYVDTADKGLVLPRYTIGAVRDLLLRAGANLVDERKAADVVAELRTGAQAVDRKAFLVGVPAFTIPVPVAGPLSTPELAVFKRDSQHGISKVALTLYNARTGALVNSTGVSYGDSRNSRYSALLVFTWSEQDVRPEKIAPPSDDQSARREP